MKDISLNFGAIKDSVTRLSSMELIKESKSKTLTNFINTIKKSPVLSKQQIIYKTFENAKPFVKERLAERFISQNISMFKNINWNDIIKENRNLRLTMLSDSHVEATGGKNTKLYESIHTLIESVSKKGFSDFSREQEAYEHLLTTLTTIQENTEANKEVNDHPELNSWKYITKIAVNNFTERYSHINEQEKKVLSMLIAEDSKKSNYVEDLKTENTEIINSLLGRTPKHDTDKIEILETFRNKLANMKDIEPSKLDEYILSCCELKETLQEFV